MPVTILLEPEPDTGVEEIGEKQNSQAVTITSFSIQRNISDSKLYRESRVKRY